MHNTFIVNIHYILCVYKAVCLGTKERLVNSDSAKKSNTPSTV